MIPIEIRRDNEIHEELIDVKILEEKDEMQLASFMFYFDEDVSNGFAFDWSTYILQYR